MTKAYVDLNMIHKTNMIKQNPSFQLIKLLLKRELNKECCKRKLFL